MKQIHISKHSIVKDAKSEFESAYSFFKVRKRIGITQICWQKIPKLSSRERKTFL